MDEQTGAHSPTEQQDLLNDRGAQPTPTQAPPQRERAAPYHHAAPHITQDPINDVEPVYVTRERYETLDQVNARRHHMGVATSDPDYLPPAGKRGLGTGPARQPNASSGKPSLHYDRYLEMPKPGKSIFTSRRERKQRRAHRIILIIALLAFILAIVWFFFLR